MNTAGKALIDARMPRIGLGTWEVRGEKTIHGVLDAALAAGYRFIDSAQLYGNEKAIGKALKELLPKHNLTRFEWVHDNAALHEQTTNERLREDIFITTKLSPANQGRDKCERSIAESLENLQTSYVDLLLIHWPGVSRLKHEDARNRELRHESWQVMEGMFDSRTLRAIGVSNFNVSHLEDLLGVARVSPAVNQCECHPHYYQPELVEFCRGANIHFQAYSSFGSESHKEQLLADERVNAMAKKYDVSVISVFLLAWALSQGMSVLPRSKNPEHIRENLKAAGVVLSHEDIEAVKSTGLNKYCWDPGSVV